jgi:IS30 family transposase
LKNKSKKVVKEVIKELIEWKEIRSITTDNGTEFTDLIDICREIWIKGYRCHAYSSWEKWSVEVHNRYIRRYMPKWTCIRDYSEEYFA